MNSAKRAAEARRRAGQNKLGRQQRDEEALPPPPPSWELLAGVDRISSNSLKLALFLRQVGAAIDATLPQLIAKFDPTNKTPPSEHEHTVAEHISRVAERIQTYRLKRRCELLTPIPLDEVQYPNEQNIFNSALQCFLIECQCNVAIGLLLKRHHDERAGVDFPFLYERCMLMVQRRLPLMQYSLNMVRLAVLKLMRMWHLLPVLNAEFVEYVRLLRYRASVLQSSATSDLQVLDYPDWVVAVGRHDSTQFYKTTLHFTRELELYFHQLARLMEHHRAYVSVASSVDSFVSTPAQRERFTEWMEQLRDEVFVEQWGRETVELSLKLDVLPTEREVYRWHNPQASFDQREILRFFRRDRMDQINQLLFVTNGAGLLEAQPLVARYFQAMFLLQTYADSFQLDRYMYWHIDVPQQPDGTSYPDLSFFTRLTYPVIYVPQCMQHIWLIDGAKIYDCGTNLDTALAEFLARALRMTDCTEFNKLRAHLRTGMKAIWPKEERAAAAAAAATTTNAGAAAPMVLDDEEGDANAHLESLLEGIVGQQQQQQQQQPPRPQPPPPPLQFNA